MTRFDQPAGEGYEPSASGVSHRVQSILEAAEQAARDIRYEAEMEKRRMTRESDRRVTEVDDGLRRMAAVADALVERADELRRQVDEMIGTLRRPEPGEPAPPRHDDRPQRPRFTGAAPRTRSERRAPEPPQHAPEPPQYEPEPAPPEPEPVAYEPPPPPAPVVPPGELGPERLVAIQMAMAGRSREEAADRLVRGFGLEDPNPLLDEVFD